MMATLPPTLSDAVRTSCMARGIYWLASPTTDFASAAPNASAENPPLELEKVE